MSTPLPDASGLTGLPPSPLASYFRRMRALLGRTGDKVTPFNTLLDSANADWIQVLVSRLHFLSPVIVFGLETPLWAGEKHADLCLSFRRGDWSALTADRPSPLPPVFAEQDVWRRIGVFANRWASEDANLGPIGNDLWMEFDLCGPPPAVPLPSVFFSLACRPGGPHRPANIVHAGLNAFEVELSSDRRRVLDNCLAILTRYCTIYWVGLMLSRPSCPIRVCALHVEASRFLDLLDALGLPAVRESRPDILARLLEFGPYISAVDIDVGEELGTKVGIEIRVSKTRNIREQRQSEEPRRLLDWLVEAGCCAPEKRDALLGWTGGSVHRLDPHDCVPRTFEILRLIEHIKLDFRPGCEPKAKAYLLYEAD